MTGEIDIAVELTGSCEEGEEDERFERFDYEVTAALNGAPLMLPQTGLDVVIDYDCGGDTVSVDDPDDDGVGCIGDGMGCTAFSGVAFPGGTVTFPATCDITARVAGVSGSDFASCADSATASATVFEVLTASLTAGMPLECPIDAADIFDGLPFTLDIDGGSGDYSIVWSATTGTTNTCDTLTDFTDGDADFSSPCELGLDSSTGCAMGSVTATVTDDVCGTSSGPHNISGSRTIEWTLDAPECIDDTQCGMDETCDGGVCVAASLAGG